ncbi:phytoene synthase [Ammoniphilus oxalaticus]|uniref:Phytoene synthase n=1 Tax=Ammoniphilus oxalaticus TaxID=66863 RepID=A0A419SDT5_9BACL|nr:phytoene/squalene synthase family protein [Ammoniphilus oxalaticus]RKD21053.1 phytoene synthase [Ammoniphilus oxalaticus]
MTDHNKLHDDAMDMLLRTSRTFFIPISRLSGKLQGAVAAAYLCMRAIDEIEDHPQLSAEVKMDLLRSVSEMLTSSQQKKPDFPRLFEPYQAQLAEVTLRLADWVQLIPLAAAPSVLKSTAVMASGMADWVDKNWEVQTEFDLDQYTYYVAGLVGILLSDLWQWYDGTETDRDQAVAFGRGLQAVNIIRNRQEDLDRGVDYFPEGWDYEEMFAYAKRNLAVADTYSNRLEAGEIQTFCKIPLMLAHATLQAIEDGHEKLTRQDVTEVVSQVEQEATQK